MTGRIVPLIALAFAVLPGCGKDSPPPEEPWVKKEPIASPNQAMKSVPGKRPAGYERLHQCFLEATRQEAPADSRPPEKTLTGKSVGRIYEEVVRLWDTIKFLNEDGTRIHYSATLETSLGSIEIALDAERSPNHVRNFVALTQAGYFDGLLFDRIQHDEPGPENPAGYEEIEAGCPLGKGDPSMNSVGYWLNPEFTGGATHEPGAVGACRGTEKDTAACKFYITLSKASWLDGQYTLFGKVTRGLDVARKVFLQPVVVDDDAPSGSGRSLEPVVIRKVVIHTKSQ